MNKRQITEKELSCAMKKLDQMKFQPSLVSIKGMCEAIGCPEWITRVENSITREMRNAPELKTHVFIRKRGSSDIWLDSDGICLLFDLLAGYFGEREILDLHRYLARADQHDREEWEIRAPLRVMPLWKLRQTIEECERRQAGNPDEKEALEPLLSWAREALKERGPLGLA